MARHIMAVCVVCLLCADHLPCEQHLEELAPLASRLDDYSLSQRRTEVFQKTNLPRSSILVGSAENIVLHKDSRADKKFINYKINEEGKLFAHHRRRRRARHVEHHSRSDLYNTMKRPEITEEYLAKFFEEYGQNDGTIQKIEFERMLKRLGLYKLIEKDAANNLNDTCIPNESLVLHVKPFHHTHYDSSDEKLCSKIGNAVFCGTVNHPSNHQNYSLNENEIYNICPVLLYQLASPLKQERDGCINSTLLLEIDHVEELFYQKDKEDIIYIWVYSFVSVFACGILGLVGVAIIPFMDSWYYKHIIQFLVSLAIGTMTGDALLHLLPHSLSGQSESNMIYKGLTCMGGILFFYTAEHGLTMISEWKKNIAKKEKQTSRVKVVRDPDSSINNSVAGDRVCKAKYSSYPYCYDEIAMDTKNDVWLHLPNNTSNKENSNADRRKNGKEIKNCNDLNETAQGLLSQNNYTPISELNHLPDSNTISTNLDETSIADASGGGNGKNKPLVHNDTVTVILREHESTHHGHSHKHGHVHSPPNSLSAVAWMIIMGDGLHNFTDGMAIGAAFAENIAGGFSTSLAVFCHELPHELGDFAILMKAGMSVKSAVYYNLLTGILSFIGMIFGIVFGQAQDAAQWMFAAAAGLFIYIALVDMMPEVSGAHKSFEQFLLQVVGMCSGVLIMLLIAIYEGDLMNVFTTSTRDHYHVH